MIYNYEKNVCNYSEYLQAAFEEGGKIYALPLTCEYKTICNVKINKLLKKTALKKYKTLNDSKLDIFTLKISNVTPKKPF